MSAMITGRHTANAICVGSDHNEDEQDEEEKVARELGKRKALRVDEEEEEEEVEDEEEDGADDSAGELTTEEAAKKQKRNDRARPTKSIRFFYHGKGMMAQKSAPGALRFLMRPPPQTIKVERRGGPSSPVRPPEAVTLTPPVAHGQEDKVQVTVKNEPPPPTVSTTPPTLPRASSSAGASTATPSTPPRTVPLLHVEGVSFPARPDEQYRVRITRAVDMKETTIWMEAHTSYDQRQFTLSDITTLGTKRNDLIPGPVLYQALYKAIMALSDKVTVEPPPPPPLPREDAQSNASSGDASSINFIRDGIVDYIELRYPETSIWSLRHRFPMALVPVSRREHALRDDLGRTKLELRATQRKLDFALNALEACKRQHGHLEHETQTLEQTTPQPPPPSQSQPSATPPPPVRATSHAQSTPPTQSPLLGANGTGQ